MTTSPATFPVGYFWPTADDTGHSACLTVWKEGLLLPRKETPTAFKFVAGASGLVGEPVTVENVSGLGFIGATQDASGNAWLLGYYGDVSYLPGESGQIAYPIPNAASGDVFAGATFCNGFPYFAAANGDLFTVSGGTVTQVTPGFGERVASISTDGTKLYAALPSSSNLATYTLSTPTTGSVSKTSTPMTTPAIVAGSVSGYIAVAGWSNSAIVSGASSFAMNATGSLVVAANAPANRIITLGGTEPDWAITAVVSGTGAPQYAQWASSGEQVLVTDATNGKVQVFALVQGALVPGQVLSVAGASQIAVTPDGQTAFVAQPSQNSVSVLTNTLNTWSIAQTITLTTATSICVLSNSLVVIGSSGVASWVSKSGSTWSVGTQVTGLGFTPNGIVTDGLGKFFAAGGSGTGHLACFTDSGLFTTSVTWSGSADTIYFEQAQIAVADKTNSLIRVYARTGTSLVSKGTISGPTGVTAIGYTNPSVWLCGVSGISQYLFTAPWILVPQKNGVVGVWHASSWLSTALEVGHQPSAAIWDVSGSLWVVTLQNDLLRYSNSLGVQFDYDLLPDSHNSFGVFPSLGLSALAWWQGGLYASSSQDQALILVSGAAPPPSGATVPSAPTGLQATNITTSGMTISWNASFTGTLPINYQLQFRISGTSNWNAFGTSSPATSANINNLVANTSYDFQVAASNVAGSTTSSVLTQATQTSTQQGTAPSVPTGLQVTNITDTTATLSWNPSTSGTQPINYQAQWRPTGTTTWSSGALNSGVSLTITGLTQVTNYDFQVIAINSIGSSVTPIVNAKTQATQQPPPLVTFWNPNDQSGMQLSNNNLTATTNTNSQAGVRSEKSQTSGLKYVEFTLNTANTNESVGIANSNWSQTNPRGVGGDAFSIGLNSNGTVFFNGQELPSPMTAWKAGAVLGMASNFNVDDVWFTYDGVTWNANGSGASPVSGISGYSFISGGTTADPWATVFSNSFGPLGSGAGSGVTIAPPFFLAYGALGGVNTSTPNALTGQQFNGANLYPNYSLSGGVSGTTTLPTDWFSFGDSGITVTYVGGGTTSNGVPYADVRFHGTTAATSILLGFGAPTVGGSVLATLGYSLALQAGSVSGITQFDIGWNDNNSTGFIDNVEAALPTPTAVLTQSTFSATTNSATVTATLFITLFYNSGVAIDCTLRIAGIQFGTPAQPVIYGPSNAVVGSSAQQQSAVAPPAAAAVGYNTLTFGPAVQPLGTALRAFSFFGTVPGNPVQNADGSITITTPSTGFGGDLCTAGIVNGAKTWQNFNGVAFGGGCYAEAIMSQTGGNTNPGMSFWANDIESMNGGSVGDLTGRQWPGQATGYGNWIEVDAAEFDASGDSYGMGNHNFYGLGSSPSDANTGSYPGWVSPVTPASGIDWSQPHRFGWLWVPAKGAPIAPTNILPNSAESGAVVGTPGTTPTGWNFTRTDGLSTEVVALGTDPTSGNPSMDFRLFGTTNGTGDINLFFCPNTGIAVNPSSIYTATVGLAVVAGTNPGNMYIDADNLDSGGGLVSSNFLGITLTGTMTNYEVGVATTAATAFENFQFGFFGPVSGTAVDVTFRIVYPQLLQKSTQNSGYQKFFFDGAQVGTTLYWDQWSSGETPPPVQGSTAYNVLDTRHLSFIFGCGNAARPVTVHSFEVWQASAANNLPATIPVTGFALNGFVLSDTVTTGSFQLSASCKAGTLSVTSGSPVTGNGTASLMVTDTFVNLQTAVNTLVYSAPAGTGSDTITVSLQAVGGNGAILITPGNGSFTDAQNNTYTIDTSDNALENNQPMNGGGGTGAMEYYNGVVYAQDASSGTWYTWDGTQFQGPVTAPPAPSGNTGAAQSITIPVTVGSPAASTVTLNTGTTPFLFNIPQGFQPWDTSPPGPITNLQGSPTNISVILTWNAPTTGTAPITALIQYRVTGTTNWTTAATNATGTTFTVTGLSQGVSYDFQAFAVNPYGSAATAATCTVIVKQQLSGPGPDATSSFIRADFTAAYNYPSPGTGQMQVSQKLWGVMDGAAGDGGQFGPRGNNTNGNAFCAFTATNFQAAAAQLNPGIWVFVGNLYGNAPGWFNADNTVNPVAFENLINNFYKVDPLQISSVMFGLDFTYGDPTNYAAAMGNLAAYMNDINMPNGRKFPCIGFVGHNEPDFNYDIATTISYYQALVPAIKNVNSNYLVMGPQGSWWDAVAIDTFMQQVSGLDGIVFDDFPEGNGAAQGSGLWTDPNFSTAFGGAVLDALPLLQYTPKFLMQAGNVDSAVADPDMAQYFGAIWCAKQALDCVNASPYPMQVGIWDSFYQGPAGMIDGPSVQLTPKAYVWANGVRRIFGPRWQVTTNSAGLLHCATTPGPSSFSLMLLNAGNGDQNGKQVALAHWPINATGNGTANYVQITSATVTGQPPTPQTVTVTKGLTAPMNFPDPSVTFMWI